jgi:aldose 1-epimerase
MAFEIASGTVSSQPFGQTAEGTAVESYLLTNSSGMEVMIMTYGGVVISLKVPDRHGDVADVVLGFDTLDEYLESTRYFGAIAGRFANRIARGQFALDGVTVCLGQNRDGNHLHGGFKGFDTVVWTASEIRRDDSAGVELTYFSKDGEEAYPGKLQATVLYLLTPENELRIEYSATTDKATIVNLTNHSYFNLAGDGDILGHQLTIPAAQFTPVDSTLIPTGELRSVRTTPFDFISPKLIGEAINDPDEQLGFAGGYDHNFVLKKPVGEWGAAAKLYEPHSGRLLDIFTTQPGLQFYSGNYLEGIRGKRGARYEKYAGCCLETQHFPDSPNHPAFPSTILRPGEHYRELTAMRFSAS